ncbi:hypothetical protein D3C77_728570 [compost metagenome]
MQAFIKILTVLEIIDKLLQPRVIAEGMAQLVEVFQTELALFFRRIDLKNDFC